MVPLQEHGGTATWARLFARRLDDRPAVVSSSGTWSGRELARRAAGAADWLDGIGAEPGRPVAALLTGSADAYALAVGCAASRRPLAPLGTRMTAPELAACLDPFDAQVLVAEPSSSELAHAVAEQVGLTVAVLPALAGSDRPLDLDPDPGDAALYLHTSGTSGTPKPVRCDHGRLARRTSVYARDGSLGPGSVFATASPFHHTAGLGMVLVALGAGAAVLPVGRFSPDAWVGAVRGGATNALLVPSMIDQLLDEGRMEAGGLRCLQYGASPIHQSTLRRLIDALPGVRIEQIYGQTEGSPITCLTHDDHLRAVAGEDHLLGSAGRPVPGVELRIEDPDGDGVGEVHARGDHFFGADATGWLRTGDLGRIDEAGYLYLTGRLGDMIVRGGENVYPEEVERVIRSHDAVRDAAVVGEPDVRLGQRVVAHVVPADPERPPTVEELRAHTRAVLAGYKVPERWVFVGELPRNPAGKILRRLL